MTVALAGSDADGFHFEIRPYRPGDFESLFALDQECFVPQIAYSRDDLRYFLEAKDALSLVAEDARTAAIAGFLIAQLYRGKPTFQARIITIDVAPALRRRHLASQLMQACEDELRRQHVLRVRLEVAVSNTAAQTFYQRRGYQQVGTLPGYYPTGEDALSMQKSLGDE
jgi:ribosomal protein S18 acetylase RimI-like enzyme